MKRKNPSNVLIGAVVLFFLGSVNLLHAQVQIDRDLQMNGAPGQRDITGAETVDASVGYLFNGVGTAGQVLRSNGTNGFVAAFIQAGDLPSGSGNYIQNQFGVQSGNFNISGTGRAAALQLTNSSTNLSQGSSGALRITTPTGLVDIGSQNASWVHFSTDRPRYYFNKAITVDEGLIGSYDEDLQLQTQGSTRITVLNSNGNVGIGLSPAHKLHVGGNTLSSGFTAAQQDIYGGQTAGSQSSFGSTWRLGSWQGGTPNSWLYLTNGANTAYHDLAVGNLHVSGTIQGPGAPVGDNLGNHAATTTLNMNSNNIGSVNDIYCTQNYGRGLVGVYSDTRYQNVFAMGTSYRLAADGTTPGNLYGLAWTHSNIGGQSISGLGHQLLAMSNGATTAAMGNGFWTNYGITTGSNGTYNRFHTWTDLPGFHGIYSSAHNSAHFYPNNGSYGAWRIDGNRNGWYGIEFATNAGNTTFMTSHSSQGWGGQQTGMHNNAQGWLWRFDHQRLFADGLTDMNDGNYLVDPNGTSYVNEQYSHTLRTGYLDFRYAGGNSGQGTSPYAIFQEGGGWSNPYPDLRIAYHTGISLGANYQYNGVRFFTDYDMSDVVMAVNDINSYFGYHSVEVYGPLIANSLHYWSTRERKKEIEKFTSEDYKSSLALVEDLDLNYYKIREEVDPLTTATQIGFIAEETPSVLSGPKRNAISISNLMVLNTGAIKAINEKVETLEKQNRTISDFGVEQMTSAQLLVKFSEEFKSQLNGAQAVVTATPAQLGVSMSVSQVSTEGFVVEISPATAAVNFNWIAMAKVESPADDKVVYSENFVKMLKEQGEQKLSNELALKPDPELVKERAPVMPVKNSFKDLAKTTTELFPAPVHNPAPVKEEPAPKL